MFGLRYEHTRAHLIRAAVEGVCLQLRVVLDRLDRVEAVRAVRATGGTLRSPLWREVLAATLDRPLSVAGDAEGTALGAAALGLCALGHADSLADAVARLADPDPGTAARVEPALGPAAPPSIERTTTRGAPSQVNPVSPSTITRPSKTSVQSR